MAMENLQTISCPKCDLSVSSICSKCNKEVEVSQLADGCVVQIVLTDTFCLPLINYWIHAQHIQL